MKGRTPTADEKAHMNAVAAHGCYCCNKMGIFNDYILIHHVDGRTKPGAHFKVIGLCDPHHSPYHHEGLHNNKTRWEAKWGKQEDILLEYEEQINE